MLLEAKSQGLTESIYHIVNRLEDVGMWISDEIRESVLILAGEEKE